MPKINKKILRGTLAILFIFQLFFSLPTHAKKSLNDAAGNLSAVVAPTGISEGNVNSYLANLIAAALVAVGLLFFVLMVYAGVRWFSSRGEEEYVNKARNTMVGSVIGMVIVASAYALSTFVISRVSTPDFGGYSGLPDAGGITQPGEGQVCCIVPATSNIGSPYTASLRSTQQCWQFAVEAYPTSGATPEDTFKKAGEKRGDGWEMYETVKSLDKCLEIFQCWDEVHLEAGFQKCLSEIK